MSYKILSTGRFDKEVKRLSKKYPSLKNEYGKLVEALSVNPFLGTPVKFGCYKIRLSIASKQKGKSGGARVITNVHIKDEQVYLLTIYDKSEAGNITDKELQQILKEIE